MTLKTRLFGKKIKEETIEQLLEVMGENPSILNTSLERWITEEVKGKCTLTPVIGEIDVDLYIFRTDFHDVDGTIDADKEARASGAKTIYNVKKFHRTGKIPYSKLGGK